MKITCIFETRTIYHASWDQRFRTISLIFWILLLRTVYRNSYPFQSLLVGCMVVCFDENEESILTQGEWSGSLFVRLSKVVNAGQMAEPAQSTQPWFCTSRNASPKFALLVPLPRQRAEKSTSACESVNSRHDLSGGIWIGGITMLPVKQSSTAKSS